MQYWVGKTKKGKRVKAPMHFQAFTRYNIYIGGGAGK